MTAYCPSTDTLLPAIATQICTRICGRRPHQSLLSAMFTMFTIVFVGASMADPEIKLLLSYIAHAFSPTSGPNHYALMSEEELTTVEKDRWLRDMKVSSFQLARPTITGR